MPQIPLWEDPPTRQDQATVVPSVEEFLNLLMAPNASTNLQPDLAAVRQWALAHGIQLAPDEPVPDFVMAAYEHTSPP